MLQSRVFLDRILRHQHFTNRILSVIVDEAHCISHWGADFRKKYASLGSVRSFLPRGTPVIAVTATLTARTRRDIQSKLNFPRSGQYVWVNAGNDRPNVSILVRAMEHPQNTYTDLDFLIDSNICSKDEIPKCYIYIDDIKTGGEIIDHLTNLLVKSNANLTQGVPVVRPFNATLSDEYRTTAMEAFRTGDVRILVCTDAAGMVKNFSDQCLQR